MSNIPNLNLFINNNVYTQKFDFEIVMEKEIFVNITLYNLLLEKDLNNIDIEIFIENCSVFKGKVNSYNLEEENWQMVLNLGVTADTSFLDNLNFLNKGEALGEVIPCNLDTNIKAKQDIPLVGTILEKLEILKNKLNLPYFAILKDKINFVNFNSQAKEIKNLIFTKMNRTDDNFTHIEITSNYNNNLNVGDIISYNKSLYAIETIIYYFTHERGLIQETHVINNQLHNIRYLN